MFRGGIMLPKLFQSPPTLLESAGYPDFGVHVFVCVCAYLVSLSPLVTLESSPARLKEKC